jgi:hypothetical protein
MYTPKSIMSSNTRFETWSFDKACMRMDENTLHTAGIVVTVDVGAVDNSDLIIFGIYGITKDVVGDDVPEPFLSGKAKDFNETHGGVLSDMMIESYKTFKHGGAIGSTTPTLLVIPAGRVDKKNKHTKVCMIS